MFRRKEPAGAGAVVMKQKLTLNIDKLIEEITVLAVREKRSLSDLTKTFTESGWYVRWPPNRYRSFRF